MRPTIYLILVFNFLVIGNIYCQKHVCDTSFIIRNKFTYLAVNIDISKYQKRGCSFTQTFLQTNDSSSYYLSNNIGSSYFIFLDKKFRKIEEGYWLGEFFKGLYCSYYKNGRIKSKGQYDGMEKIGTWLYYNENGVLIKTEKY